MVEIQQFWSDILVQRADEIREYFHADAYVIGIAPMSISRSRNL